MRNACLRARVALSAVFILIASVEARATTIATFADPSDGSVPVFTVDLKAQTISALWDDPGLTLHTVAGTFANVLMAMPLLSFDANFNTGAGHVEFLNPDESLLLRIDFSSGQLNNPFSFGSTEFLSLAEVDFSGPVVNPPGVVDGTESFSFAFANQTSTPTGYTATAAFTSSGQLVPEPGMLLSFGILGLLALKRRRC